MRIAIVTALYKRPEITQIVLSYFADLAAKSEHQIGLFCVGSEGDVSRSLAESNNWSYLEFPNFTDSPAHPLSQKFNALFSMTRGYDPDLLILVGSDDLVSPEIIDFYARTVGPNCEQLIGLRDLYIHSAETKETVYFPGYPTPGDRQKTIGAGRCFSRRVLQLMDYRPWGDEKANRGLDSVSSRRMRYSGISELAYKMAEMGGCAVDIKDADTCLTSWDRFQNASKLSDNTELYRFFRAQFAALESYTKKCTFDNDKSYWIKIKGRPRLEYHRGDTVRRFINKGIVEQ